MVHITSAHCSLPTKLYQTVQDSEEEIFTSVFNWLNGVKINDIVAKVDLLNIISETRSNAPLLISMKQEFDKFFNYLEDIMKTEKRSTKDLIGSELSTKLLREIELIDIYEPSSVRSFLQTPVFESMIGGILYEGIFEFLQRVDILGNIVNQLPIIGPIRQTIIKEFKNNLDKTIGGQIKTFLSSFNKVAIGRMVDFILSPQNRASLSKANTRVVDSFLNRPINQLVVSKENSDRFRESLWSTFTSTSLDDIDLILTKIYERIGDYSAVSKIDSDLLRSFWRSSPTSQKIVTNNLKIFLQSSDGQKALNNLLEIKNNY
eukprot:gene5308-7372_t